MKTVCGPSYEEEQRLLDLGFLSIAGVDEVGRGPLAGPVVCAAVILNPEYPIEGLNDSKKLSARKREQLAEEIVCHALAYSVSHREAWQIDRMNILEATREAMAESIAMLQQPADAVLIDAVKLPANDQYAQFPLVKGDQRSVSIAAASILAKVGRDRLLDRYDAVWPEYGFSAHKGYGTKRHYAVLDAIGPTTIHRKTFLVKWEARRHGQSGLER